MPEFDREFYIANVIEDERDRQNEIQNIITAIARLMGYEEEPSKEKPVIERTVNQGDKMVHTKKIYDFDFGKRSEKLKEEAKQYEGEFQKFKEQVKANG